MLSSLPTLYQPCIILTLANNNSIEATNAQEDYLDKPDWEIGAHPNPPKATSWLPAVGFFWRPTAGFFCTHSWWRVKDRGWQGRQRMGREGEREAARQGAVSAPATGGAARQWGDREGQRDRERERMGREAGGGSAEGGAVAGVGRRRRWALSK
jgi:hypothetical protein